MSNPRPFDSLRADLIRRGLPRSYVRRVVEELEDHRQDIRAEASSTPAEARLGNLAELAAQIVSEYRARRFVGRHPLLAFLIAPIPLVASTWLAMALAFGFGSSLLLPQEPGNWSKVNLYAASIYYALRFIPFAIVALVLCRSAYQSAQGRWSLVACALVAGLAGTLVADVRFHVGPHDGSLTFGPLFLTPGMTIGRQLAQMAAPLAIGLWFAVKFEHRRRLAMRAADLVPSP